MLLHPLQEEWDADLLGGNPLDFPGYTPPTDESVVTGRSDLGYALISNRFEIQGGSMGAAHGERVVRAYRRAVDERLPVVVVTASGGARLHEGMVSLIQLPRTAAAAAAHAAAGLLQIAIHRGPTTGGVFASYASLADVRAAEPGATIGFAGPRVVELTTGVPVSSGSHTAETAFAAGIVDALVHREQQAVWVEGVLGHRPAPWVHPGWVGHPGPGPADGPWGEVLRARASNRPPADAWAARLCSSWTGLQPAGGDGDAGVVAGLATFEARRVVVIATRRTHLGACDYSLAQRAIALAGRLGLPLVTLVDTPGADPSPRSESAGIARAIANTFAAMAQAPVPTVSVCVGEGGSGGALALAGADRFLMLQHAIFTVISPEGAAAILDRTPDAAPERAADLKLTSADLLRLRVVDEVIQESDAALRRAIARALAEAKVGERHDRFDAATAPWVT